MKKTAQEQIIKALKALGVHGRVRLDRIDSSRVVVFLNRRIFGIYDLDRRTFVD